jgi:tetratricopeptide (TPR) repeat protein
VQALYQLEALALEQGWTATNLTLAGELWAELGDLGRAVEYWEAALTPDAGAALVRKLVEGYIRLQQWTEATIALNQLLDTAPDEAWAHYQLGLLQSYADPAAAAEHLRIAARSPIYQPLCEALLALLPSDDPSVTALQSGLVLAANDLWPQAEAAFAYAAALGDPYPQALAYAGLARDQQGKDGSEQIARAVALGPQIAELRYLEGLHHRLNGDDAASIAALLIAVEIDPQNPAYAAELGAAYQQSGDFPQAQFWLQQALTLSGGDSRFEEMLEQLNAQLGS